MIKTFVKYGRYLLMVNNKMSYAQIHFRKLKFEFLDSIQLLENYGLKKKKFTKSLLTYLLGTFIVQI